MAVFNLIQHTELSGAAASFDVTSIPASYDHLYMVASAKTDQVAWIDDVQLTFNGVGGTSYGATSLYAGTSAPQGGGGSGHSSHSAINYIYVGGAETSSDTFGTVEIWVPNYANTSNFTQAIIKWGTIDSSSTDYQWLTGQTAGLFSNTAAINQFTLDADGNNFTTHSTFTLYGINGAG
tara:strand:- start:7 stop:543 length:537 start_codon:yes stop_codon:yes gene_type:complete